MLNTLISLAAPGVRCAQTAAASAPGEAHALDLRFGVQPLRRPAAAERRLDRQSEALQRALDELERSGNCRR